MDRREVRAEMPTWIDDRREIRAEVPIWFDDRREIRAKCPSGSTIVEKFGRKCPSAPTTVEKCGRHVLTAALNYTRSRARAIGLVGRVTRNLGGCREISAWLSKNIDSVEKYRQRRKISTGVEESRRVSKNLDGGKISGHVAHQMDEVARILDGWREIWTGVVGNLNSMQLN